MLALRSTLFWLGLLLVLPQALRVRQRADDVLERSLERATEQGLGAAERADLWLTGEMSHHEALAAVRQGTAVILAEHSNTERGYLKVLQRRMRRAFGRRLEVRVARADADPFVYHTAGD